MKGNIQKTSGKEEQQDEQAGAVDQIKKKYGFSSSSNVSNFSEVCILYHACLTYILLCNNSQACDDLCFFTGERCT